MSYTLPVFNLTSNIWHDPDPVTDPPALSPAVQKYVNSRGLLDIDERDDDEWNPPIWLRFPFGTDVRRLDKVECPAGSGRYYHVRWVENVHEGFSNQYTAGICHQIASVPPPPPSGDFLLLESGDFVLLETGDKIILE